MPILSPNPCAEGKRVIEIDGDIHGQLSQEEHDKARDAWLAERGYAVIRFPTKQVEQDLAGVLRRIMEAVIEAAQALKNSLMQYLFTYGPVKVDQASNLLLKDDGLGPCPQHRGWREVNQLGDTAEETLAADLPERELDLGRCLPGTPTFGQDLGDTCTCGAIAGVTNRRFCTLTVIVTSLLIADIVPALFREHPLGMR